MLTSNKYRSNPFFQSALTDINYVIEEFINDSSGSVTLANVNILDYCWYSVDFLFTVLYIDYTLPHSGEYSTFFILLPGHLTFNFSSSLSLSVLRSDLLRGDLSAYDKSCLLEEEI